MHGFIRDKLETLLRAGQQKAGLDQPVIEHLSSCSECSSEFEIMKAQAELLQSLRAPEGVELLPGFYARVMQRIEERAKESIWAAFVSPFGTRLAYASLTIAVLLGSYVVARESRDGHLGGQRMIAQNVQYDAPVFGDQEQQRNAVLTNFAAH